MFKRSNNASILKDKNHMNGSEKKPDRNIVSLDADHASSAKSVQSPRDEKTIIGKGVVIEGKISGKGNLIIEGSMKGDVELEENSITIGPNGRIEGEITAMDAVIRGQVSGKINARGKVNIAQHADVCGEIKAKSIAIDDGAFFKGKIEMDRAPNRNIERTGGPMSKADETKSNVSQ